jgi:TonB family protein
MLAAALLAAALGPAAPAPPAPPPAPASKEVSPLLVIPQPKQPPPADVTVQVGGEGLRSQDVAIWPARARAAGVGGQVVLTCQVDVHGLAESCRVAYEAPEGMGFGAAALALRPTFKLTPRQGPDGPVAAAVNIAVNFRAPQLDTNIGEVMRSQAAPMGSMSGDPHLDRHEINGGSLRVTQNPLDMRRMTMMTEPAWAQAPDFAAWAAAYPAQGGGVEGYAVVHCRVQPAGELTRCAAVKELPTGRGFGKAAVALTTHFKVSPEALAAAPRGGPVEVDVPVRFPPAAELGDRTVRAPIWLAGADPPALMRELPAATRPGPVVQCQVAADGRLGGCGIELTSPNGPEFDEAALKLAGRMRMNLWSAEASPVLGGSVHLPFGMTGEASRSQR